MINPVTERVFNEVSEKFHIFPKKWNFYEKMTIFKNKIHNLFTNSMKKHLTNGLNL